MTMKKGKWDIDWYFDYLQLHLNSPKKITPAEILRRTQHILQIEDPWSFKPLKSALKRFYLMLKASLGFDIFLRTIEEWIEVMEPHALATSQNRELHVRVLDGVVLTRLGDLARWLSGGQNWPPLLCWSAETEAAANTFTVSMVSVLSHSRPESEAPEYEGWITVKDAAYRYINRWRAEFGAGLDYDAARQQITRAYGKQIETVGKGKGGRKLNPDTVDDFIDARIRAEKSTSRACVRRTELETEVAALEADAALTLDPDALGTEATEQSAPEELPPEKRPKYRMKSKDHHYAISYKQGEACNAKERLFVCAPGAKSSAEREEKPVESARAMMLADEEL